MRDFTKICNDYAKECVKKRNKKVGKWVKLAAKRYLNDLKRSLKRECPFYFSKEEAVKACAFVENLPHVEGTWDTVNIVLHSSDIFFICNIFGFRKRENDTRRFTTALKAVGRKNAKSTGAAGIALYCQVMENEEGAQIVTAATTGGQARIVFNIAKKMADKSPELREAFNIETFANAIVSYDNGGQMRPINAKASTQDGLNPSVVVLDEIHAHKTHDLLNVLKSASGARRNPLFILTTTEGYDNPGPWSEYRDFSKKVLEGIVEAEHFFVLFYAVDDDDDDFDESCWIKANPLMEVNDILLPEIRKEAIEAKIMPGKMSEFRIKRLNRQTATSQGWIDFDKWKLCGGDFDYDILKNHECYGGLDLANTRDLASFRLIWEIDEVIYTRGWRYVPESQVHDRSVRGLVPYQAWVSSGHLITTAGDVIDHDMIFNDIVSLKDEYNIQKIGYDRWNASQLTKNLEEEGVPLEEFIQGTKSYHPAMQYFERTYIQSKLRHGDDPVLNWNASNIITRTDQNMNTAPDKKKSGDKIDDMVALLMAFGMKLRYSNDSYEDDFNDFLCNPIGA